MADRPVLRLWAGRGIYLAIACAVIFIRLLPLGHLPEPQLAPGAMQAELPLAAEIGLPDPRPAPPDARRGLGALLAWLGTLPGPDLLLAVTAAWVLRRPNQVPPLLIAAVFLTCDMLFLRPPGLWTLIVLLATEFLRARETLAREQPFLLEWALVAMVLVAAMLAERLALSVFVLPKPAVGVALLHILITLLVYPAVVAALRFGLGLRRAAPAELEATRGRI